MNEDADSLKDSAMHDNYHLHDDLTHKVGRALATVEELTAAQVCFRPVARRWRALGDQGRIAPFFDHRSPFCLAQKAENLAACTRCDNQDAFLACAGQTSAFPRTCYAGVRELLLPLWVDGSLTGVVFLGELAEERTSTEHRASALVDVLDMLRARLVEVFHELGRVEVGSWQGTRALIIEEYLRESLTRGPSLSELAQILGVSTSRAGHIVQNTTGASFQQVVATRRMELASDFLLRTDSTVAWVAHQIGFRDVGYFCRYFKDRIGVTPSQYRKEHGKPLPV